MNRFIIDADVDHEIVKVYEVEQFLSRHTEKEQIGMGHFILFLIFLFRVSHCQ